MQTTIRVSSSIANFREKLTNYLQLPEWHWWRNRNDRVVFFGLYHWKDYLRFIWHRGPKKVFWCGSDISALRIANFFWLLLMSTQVNAKFYVENEVEREVLEEFWIGEIEIRPMLFDDPDKYQIDKDWPKSNWFITYHKGREKEYGKDIADYFPWIDVLENLTSAEFDGKIKAYQGTIRFNEFDGFSENLAKSLLMGQYPISRIKYQYCIDLDGGLSYALQKSMIHQTPNYEASNYWRKTLKENKDEVTRNWSW